MVKLTRTRYGFKVYIEKLGATLHAYRLVGHYQVEYALYAGTGNAVSRFISGAEEQFGDRVGFVKGYRALRRHIERAVRGG